MYIIFFAFLIFGLISIAGLCWVGYLFYKERLDKNQLQFMNRVSVLHDETRARQQIFLKDTVFSEIPSIDNLLKKLRFAHWISSKLIRAGSNYSFFHFLVLSFSLFIISCLITLYFTNAVLLANTVGLTFILLPYLYIEWRIKVRQSLLEKQLPDVMDFISRSLKAGHSLNSSIKIAVSESPEPIASEFKLVFDQINFGAEIYDALQDLTYRVDCAEIRYFVMAVLINREVGGDLSELLQNVSRLIRERLILKQSIHVLTAEGRTSAWILGILPFFLGAVISYINPSTIKILFTDEIGKQLLLINFLMMVIGVFWMYRITSIKA